MRRRRRFRRRLSPAAALLLLIAILVARHFAQLPTDADPEFFESGGPYVVARVVDGDTLLLENGQRIRLLGVDTPETKHPNKPVEWLGPEAAEFTRRHVEGKPVRLEFDRERLDRYRRVLAYVYLGEWFLNEELIVAGYSRAETGFPYSETMKRRFRNAESRAREARAGLWAEEPP